MSDNQRNNYSFDTLLEIVPEVTNSYSSEFISVLLTHDFCSIDSSYGRIILKNYIKALSLASDKTVAMLLNGTAVRLLADDDIINDFILISENKPIYVSQSAILEFNITLPEGVSLVPISDEEFIHTILELNPITIC